VDERPPARARPETRTAPEAPAERPQPRPAVTAGFADRLVHPVNLEDTRLRAVA
jgi:hypothetical protein